MSGTLAVQVVSTICRLLKPAGNAAEFKLFLILHIRRQHFTADSTFLADDFPIVVDDGGIHSTAIERLAYQAQVMIIDGDRRRLALTVDVVVRAFGLHIRVLFMWRADKAPMTVIDSLVFGPHLNEVTGNIVQTTAIHNLRKTLTVLNTVKVKQNVYVEAAGHLKAIGCLHCKLVVQS